MCNMVILLSRNYF
uniref:Uncharacterized protein n=1 Tax=Arundo donax TaxID=35708 RepID=A0A0A8ZIV0_ARUDO